MRTLSTTLLAGIGALALIGTAAFAATVHQMTVQLPEGGVAQIQYTGDTAPKVSFGTAPMDAAWSNPFVYDPAFAEMQQINAQIDRDMNALFAQTRAISFDPFMLAPDGAQPIEAALRDLPPGASSVSVVSMSSGNGVCTRMVQVTQTRDGKPMVVSQTSGNCGTASGNVAVQNPSQELRPDRDQDARAASCAEPHFALTGTRLVPSPRAQCVSRTALGRGLL